MSDIKLLNGDAYKLIKELPDKSVDLIYTDIPYEYENGGKGGTSFIVSEKVADTYHNKIVKFSYGIDYAILDEFVRVCKSIYIYIFGVVEIKYTQFQSSS